jgi:hypothetical protein
MMATGGLLYAMLNLGYSQKTSIDQNSANSTEQNHLQTTNSLLQQPSVFHYIKNLIPK